MCRIRIYLVLVFFYFFLTLSANITKDTAIDIVFSEVIQDQIDSINVYVDSLLVSTVDYTLNSYKSIVNPYNQSWLFFIDDMPRSNWEHPCRYVFVNISNGNYQVISETTSKFNYQEVLEEVLISIPFTHPAYSYDPINIQRSRNPDPHKWAVFISGYTQYRFWNDMSHLYCALTLEEDGRSYNYSDTNINVLSWDGNIDGEQNRFNSFYGPFDTSEHIDDACTRQSIVNTFSDLAAQLGQEDMLFIYMTDHGGTDPDTGSHFIEIYDGNGGSEHFYDYEFISLLDSITCAQIIIVMQQCRSGGFIAELKAPNRLIYSSTSSDTYSTGGHYDPNHPANDFDEFSYFWTSAVRQKHPHNHYEPWIFEESVGENIYFQNIYGFPDYNPDFPQTHPDLDSTIGDSDGIIQMGEAFQYAKAMDAFVEDCYIYENDGRNEYPQCSNGSVFIEDVYSLQGISGQIVNTQSIYGNFHIGGDLQICGNTILTVQAGSFLFLNNDSKIIVDENSSLIIEDNVTVKGNCIDNSFHIYGNIQIGNNVKFTSTENQKWDGLNIYNSNPIILRNSIFENCSLKCDQTTVLILDSQFTNSDISHNGGSIEINQSNFSNSFITADALGGNYIENPEFIFKDNIVSNSEIGISLSISSYDNYKIINNIIDCNGIGIDILESGSGIEQLICDNEIFGTSYGCAIRLYHSYVYIKGSNEIYDKSECIIGYNNSEINISGNTNIPYQKFRNASFSELKFTHDSFPSILRFNAIYDDNHNYDLLFCSGHSQSSREHDVRYNYWGSNFDPMLDYYPQGAYLFNPQWNPNGFVPVASEVLFIQAEQYELIDDYNSAKQTYKSIITIYPESPFALSSAKKLLALEKKLGYSRNNSDFVTLKTYYQTEVNMFYDAEIQHLSEDLANYCDIEIANYESAISYNESIVENPPSLQDSVFAVIDAGYIYLLMENSGRSNYVGENSDLKPKSKSDFDLNRDRLLSIIQETMNENFDQYEGIPVATLNSNYPNPFNPTTTISFSLEQDSKVEILIYNVKGQKVRTLTNEEYHSGNHSVIWNGDDNLGRAISSGVYFYKFIINGRTNAIKKCLMVK